MPKVTVFLTSFNHSKYIREAIESALNQSFTDFELIIWDDASTDESWSIINEYDDPRICAFRNEENTLGTVGFDQMLAGIAKGEYIAIHHSDDIWEIEKLAKQVDILQSQPSIGAVFTLVQPIDEDGAHFSLKDNFYYNVFDQANRTRHEWLRFFFTRGNALCHPSVLIRKICYQECGSYRSEFAQLGDFDMWIRLCSKFDIHILQEKLTKFRIRDDNANVSGDRPVVQLRSYYEYYKLLDNYLEIHSFEELKNIFPEANKYYRREHTNINFALAMVALELKPFKFTELFGLNLLQNLIVSPNQAAELKKHYLFDYKNLIDLTGNYDPFNITAVSNRDGQINSLNQAVAERDGQITTLSQAIAERDGQINSLNQAVAERDGQITSLSHLSRDVAERDGQITSLNQAVAERDGQITSLSQALAERDGQITSLSQAIAELDGQITSLNQAIAERDGSTSWQITKPLRWCGSQVMRVKLLLKAR